MEKDQCHDIKISNQTVFAIQLWPNHLCVISSRSPASRSNSYSATRTRPALLPGNVKLLTPENAISSNQALSNFRYGDRNRRFMLFLNNKFHLRRSAFLKNFLSIASANLLSQLMLLAATPLLTRLYSPQDFGVAAVFLSVVQIVGSFSSWRFDRTIPNARARQAAVLLAFFGLSASILVAVLALLTIYINPWQVMQFDSIQRLGSLAYWLPAAILATGIIQLAGAWFAREGALNSVSYAVIAYSITYLVAGLIAGAAGYGSSGLVFSSVLALGCQALTLLYFTSKTRLEFRLTKRNIRTTHFRYIGMATTASVITFINTLSFLAPVFLLTKYYTLAEVGLYVLVVRIVATPLGTITKSLALSFWSRTAELVRSKDYKSMWSLYQAVSATLTALAVFIATSCYLVSDHLGLLLGGQWDTAGPVLLASIPYFIGLIIVSPTNHLFVLRRQMFQLTADGLRLLLLFTSVYTSYKQGWTFTTTVFLVACSSLIGHITLFVIHVRVYRQLLIFDHTSQKKL